MKITLIVRDALVGLHVTFVKILNSNKVVSISCRMKTANL